MSRCWITALVMVFVACGTSSPSCPADEPAGCPATPPSYTNDIAPLIQQYCVVGCHNPQGSGGTVLATWPDVSADKLTIESQIYDCRMPLAGSPQPTLTERVTLLTYFVCGAPNN